MKRFRLPFALLFFLWAGFVLAALYVTQRPLALQVGGGLAATAWSLALAGTLVANAAGLGGQILRRLFPFLEGAERFLIGTGLGLGLFGLLGFGLAAGGIARWYILLIVQAGLLAIGILFGWLRLAAEDLSQVWNALRPRPERRLLWIPVLALLFLILSCLLALAPPADSFDALAYHLAVPSLWLKNGGLSAPDILPSYWFPELGEGVFIWGLGLGSEAVPALLHLGWGLLTVLLIWLWVNRVWGNSPAWRSLALVVSMPSLPLIASWSYTDFTLIFFIAAVLHLLWRAPGVSGGRPWVLAGIFCGLAMGVKYASFVLPLAALAWIAWTHRRRTREMLRAGLLFGGAAVLVACPWYLRNWIWMGNPVYPFLFGGRFWDSFRSMRYSLPGTGIGLDLYELIKLPFDVTLGHRDFTYYDGRIGPLWLVLLPLSLWALWRLRKEGDEKRTAIYIPVLFGTVSLAAWTIGIINTSALWQSRYLFPSLLMLAPLAALAWDSLTRLDTSKLRISFIFNVLAALVVTVNLLDLGLFALVRNPLAVAIGIESRQSYYERIQPPYGDALRLVAGTPEDARIYFLYEPRSLGMDRAVQVDLILDNLAHDFHLYHTPEGILKAWRSQGYTHVLYQHAGDGLLDRPEETDRLFAMLEVVAETPNTVLYRLPPP